MNSKELHFVAESGTDHLADDSMVIGRTLADAVASIGESFQLTAEQQEILARERYLGLEGSDFVEITECVCDNPYSHAKDLNADRLATLQVTGFEETSPAAPIAHKDIKRVFVVAETDLLIRGNGFYSITAVTARGHKWLATHVQDGTDGQIYSDDSRMTQDIANGAVAAGLTVEVNGEPYTLAA